MRGMASLRLLREGNFRALWIGQLVSIFGDRFTYLALLALVLERAPDRANPAPELALIPFVSFLPAILLAPWVGALVDGWNTRATLLVADFARGLIVLAIIPAVAWGGLTAAFALIFLLYVANTFFLPARSAILPDLVPADRLVEANSLATLAGVLATIAGSVWGGVFVERFGWRLGFAMDGVTYFASVLFLAMIRPSARPRPAMPPGSARDAYAALLRSVREGARLAVSTPAVLGSIAAMTLLWTAGGALHVGAPTLIGERGGGVISSVGVAIAFAAVGMVAGTLLLTLRAGSGSGPARIEIALLGTGVATLAFALLPWKLGPSVAAFTAGIFVAVLLVTTEAVIQQQIQPEARARVFALRDFFGRLGVLVSAGCFGFVLREGLLSPKGAVAAAGWLLVLGGVGGAVIASRAGRAV
jgi:MFS family permease